MKKKPKIEPPKLYKCTDCGGDATCAYTANKKMDWGGKIKKGERICFPCGRKRGVTFF